MPTTILHWQQVWLILAGRLLLKDTKYDQAAQFAGKGTGRVGAHWTGFRVPYIGPDTVLGAPWWDHNSHQKPFWGSVAD
jgi:hypothetical protein